MCKWFEMYVALVFERAAVFGLRRLALRLLRDPDVRALLTKRFHESMHAVHVLPGRTRRGQ